MYLPLFHILNNSPPKAELYHSVSTGYAGISASIGSYLYGTGFLLTEHGIYTREREEEIIKADWVDLNLKSLWISYFKSMSACAYKYAKKIVALYEANSRIQGELGAPEEKRLVIANGINTDEFNNLPSREGRDDRIYIGAIIRFSPIKDIKTMIYAINIVKSKNPNTVFYIMGPTDESPEYFDECMELISTLKLKDVIITGRVDIKNYIGKMDIIILTSISEAQPLSLMEAMAAGKPCVATNVGCCKELFEGAPGDNLGKAGLIAPVMNYEKIAEKILQLVENPELRREMGKVAKKRINKYYTERQFVEAYKMLYDSFNV